MSESNFSIQLIIIRRLLVRVRHLVALYIPMTPEQGFMETTIDELDTLILNVLADEKVRNAEKQSKPLPYA